MPKVKVKSKSKGLSTIRRIALKTGYGVDIRIVANLAYFRLILPQSHPFLPCLPSPSRPLRGVRPLMNHKKHKNHEDNKSKKTVNNFRAKRSQSEPLEPKNPGTYPNPT
eukprot:1153893-Amorphochlora_amoeboformis.AAC.1